jgi:hypothetical protein
MPNSVKNLNSSNVAKLATYAGHITAVLALLAVAWNGAKAISDHYAKNRQLSCLEQRSKLNDLKADLEDTAEEHHFLELLRAEGSLTSAGVLRLDWLGKEIGKKQDSVDVRGEKVLSVCLNGH